MKELEVKELASKRAAVVDDSDAENYEDTLKPSQRKRSKKRVKSEDSSFLLSLTL